TGSRRTEPLRKPNPRPDPARAAADVELVDEGGDDREAHLVLSEIFAGLRRELRDRAVEAEALAGVGDLDGERVAAQLVANADHPRPAVRVGVTNRVRARLGDR